MALILALRASTFPLADLRAWTRLALSLSFSFCSAVRERRLSSVQHALSLHLLNASPSPRQSWAHESAHCLTFASLWTTVQALVCLHGVRGGARVGTRRAFPGVGGGDTEGDD